MRHYHPILASILITVGSALIGLPGTAFGQDEDAEMSPISGNPDEPRRHFRLRNAAELSPDKANRIYSIVMHALARGYSLSGNASAGQYQSWRRYNTSPYESVTHGNHYLNNYVNDIGAAYGRFESAGTLPVGTIIAKDSFSVTETDEILLGPLFLMQKMPEGFDYVTGDWRYTLIGPDGAIRGETHGEGAKRVEYCIACHLAVEHQDHLYFVPPAYRVTAKE